MDYNYTTECYLVTTVHLRPTRNGIVQAHTVYLVTADDYESGNFTTARKEDDLPVFPIHAQKVNLQRWMRTYPPEMAHSLALLATRWDGTPRIIKENWSKPLTNE